MKNSELEPLDGVSVAIRNLTFWIGRFKASHGGETTPPLVAAAEHLLAELEKAAAGVDDPNQTK